MSEAGKVGSSITNEKSWDAQVEVCSDEQTLTEQGAARDLVAKQVGLSPTTYQRAKTIIEKAPEALKEKVRSSLTR